MSNKIIMILMVICAAILTSGCLGTYVVDGIIIVEDGSILSFSLSAGTYQISINSINGEDFNLKIPGYINIENIYTFDRTITINRDTDFILSNPAGLVLLDCAEVDIIVYRKFLGIV